MTNVCSEDSRSTTGRADARIIVALFRGISMMRTSNPEVAGEELLEAAIAFVTRAQGIAV